MLNIREIHLPIRGRVLLVGLRFRLLADSRWYEWVSVGLISLDESGEASTQFAELLFCIFLEIGQVLRNAVQQAIGLAAILGGGSALPSSTAAGAGTIVAAASPPVGTSGTTTTALASSGTTVNTQISGGADATPTSSLGTAAVVGEIGIKNLDPEVRRQLEQFRLKLELFFAATTMNLESEAAR